MINAFHCPLLPGGFSQSQLRAFQCSRVEPEMNYIPVLHDVLFFLQSILSCFADRLDAAQVLDIEMVHHPMPIVGLVVPPAE